MPEKKNMNKFTIQFSEFDDIHIFAADKLNSLPKRRIANYIAQAIYVYETGSKRINLNATTQSQTTEKRRRGRPRKAVSESTDFSPVEDKLPITSSHTTESLQAANTKAEHSAESPEIVSGKKDNMPKKAASDMLNSMLGFVNSSQNT